MGMAGTRDAAAAAAGGSGCWAVDRSGGQAIGDGGHRTCGPCRDHGRADAARRGADTVRSGYTDRDH